MRCYYDVLEIERDADSETIKKAYRRLSLKWHPDKNLDNTEEASKQFTIIQQAYEVLSDPHERSWYDRHREAILKGGLDEHYQDNSLTLYPYFSSSCYSGFSNDEKGFYAVYRKVFETLASEDYEFLDDPEGGKYPSFGDMDSDYDEVVGPFYGFWQSFSTVRSFAWLDSHDIRDAPNRQVLKAMEKENKKLRDKGKKERNEQIRELVSFVRKRDERVKKHSKWLEERRKEQMRKAEENRLQKIRDHLSILDGYEENETVQRVQEENLREIEDDLVTHFGELILDHNGEESSKDESLYCIICEKVFKTKMQLSNHVKSRKHREHLEELRKHMEEDELHLLENEQEMFELEGDKERTDEVPVSRRSRKQKKKSMKKMFALDEETEEDSLAQEKHDEAAFSGANKEVENLNTTGAVSERGTNEKEPSVSEGLLICCCFNFSL
ncbi:hypothetical protein AB6A40_002892 [Gnathostoma spinigerum]|uniref:DnaJ homolog subfamily C member 21 n=1 Tax=Gnathostoma spinigerum TaxID=75299 RepID=A0ABD6EGV4_9BILA